MTRTIESVVESLRRPARVRLNDGYRDQFGYILETYRSYESRTNRESRARRAREQVANLGIFGVAPPNDASPKSWSEELHVEWWLSVHFDDADFDDFDERLARPASARLARGLAQLPPCTALPPARSERLSFFSAERKSGVVGPDAIRAVRRPWL